MRYVSSSAWVSGSLIEAHPTASNLLNPFPYQFKNLDPQGMERFIEPEDSPHARIISKFHSQGDITTVDLTQDEDEAAEVRLERLVALGGVLDASLFS